MPYYKFVNKKTHEEHTELMGISEMEDYLLANPDLEVAPAAPLIGDSYRLGIKKNDSEWTEKLKKIKADHPGSTIDV